MNILVAIFIIFFVIFLNYIRYMDMLYPPVIQGGLWILVLLMYYVYTDKFMPLSDTMCFIITIGIINFSFGSYISTFKYKPKKKFIFFKNIKEKDIILNLVFWIPIIVLPFFLYKAYSIGTSGISEDYFFNLRYELSEAEQRESYGILAYATVPSFVSVGLYLFLLIQNRAKLRFFIALIVALIYALFSTGRTSFFLLFIMLIGILIATRRMNVGKAILYLGLAGFAIFSAIGLIIGKGGASIDESFSENISAIWFTFIAYLLGGLPAFDIYMHSNKNLDYGKNIFRTVVAILHSIGVDVDVPPLVKDYQFVPMPTNVYTIYRPYFDDFSMFGIICIQFFLGLLHGLLYRKIEDNSNIYVILYAIFLYPLLMQFFQEQYFNLLSMWIQYIIVLYLYSCVQRHSKKYI